MSTAGEAVTSWAPPPPPPRTLDEFLARFPDEAACRRYLAQVCWPGGFACPACGGERCWWLGDGRLGCAGCRKRLSPTAGTIFVDAKLPLTIWFQAAWLVTNTKNGISALSLQRTLGLAPSQSSSAKATALQATQPRAGHPDSPLEGMHCLNRNATPVAGAPGT